ncbi:hypothetical protein DQ353_00605 [Arthrobacter sp. AQ5-05]|uniref:hypothetical protein n=1 Tax=Arthrobacter sp. AQ5-05 TaxID=2184581 RepID=UPI000DCDB70E|nr:hypothetical protein [Arthrobacter sp. AQ5-05]RAX50931.1 hypothetical protein DQ353_00605 [Arthrobacter sp. AQ5-05]
MDRTRRRTAPGEVDAWPRCLGVARCPAATNPAATVRGRRASRGTQAGSSIIEFIFLVVLLLVPLVYLVVGAAHVQAASYAAVGAADHAAKVFVTAQTESQGRARAADAVQRAAANMEIGPGRTHFTYSCRGTCLSAGSTVTVHVSIKTVLPLLPEGWGWSTGSVGSDATQRVDRYG